MLTVVLARSTRRWGTELKASITTIAYIPVCFRELPLFHGAQQTLRRVLYLFIFFEGGGYGIVLPVDPMQAEKPKKRL